MLGAVWLPLRNVSHARVATRFKSSRVSGHPTLRLSALHRFTLSSDDFSLHFQALVHQPWTRSQLP